MTVKRAEQIEIFLCDHCAAVHIGLFCDGEMFAEAIPTDPIPLLENLAEMIDESDRRQGEANDHSPDDPVSPTAFDQWNTDDEEFRAIAGEMLDGVLKVAKAMADGFVAEGRDPNDLGDALLAGIIQGAVAAAYRITPAIYRKAVMQYLREYLEIAIENEDATEGEGSMVQ
jgi:hypothetical protein